MWRDDLVRQGTGRIVSDDTLHLHGFGLYDVTLDGGFFNRIGPIERRFVVGS